ncbi:MAG: DUF4350 domain-containing protein [Pseudomonadota bacterium]
MRAKTTGWFLVTLMVLLVLIAPLFSDEEAISRPTSEDRKTAGLAGFSQWLRDSDVPVVPIRQRFNDVAWDNWSPTANIAVIHLPADLSYTAEEIAAINTWVAAGNRLLIAASYLEGSAWAYASGDLNRALWRLTGIHFHPTSVEPVEDTETDLDAANPSAAARAENDEEDDAQDDAELEDVVEILSDAVSAPGWMLLHGSRSTTTIISQQAHPVFGNLPPLEAPWDGALWQPVYTFEPVPPEPPLAALDNAENRAVVTEIGDEVSDASKKPPANAAVPEETELDDPPTAADAEVSLETDDEPPPRRHSWHSDLEACAEQMAANGAQHMLSGRSGCIDIPIPARDSWQTVLAHAEGEQEVLIEGSLGRGQVWLLLHPSLLDNEVIHRYQNRRFAMDLIDAGLGQQGAVFLDDAHHGLNDIIEVDDVLFDARFWASIGFLLLFWLVFLLADAGYWQRATYRPTMRGVGQQQLIAATGHFLRNRLSTEHVSQLILEPIRQRLASKWQLSNDMALTAGLEKERANNPEAVASLQHSLTQIEQGKRVGHLKLAQQAFALQRAIA